MSAHVFKLRSDLQFTPRLHGADTYYVLEDPITGKFYRMGYAEYVFVSLLDGKTPLAAALDHARRALGDDQRLTDANAMSLVQWLARAELATVYAADGSIVVTPPPPTNPHRWLDFNPVTFRVPLLHPDRVLEKLLPLARWLFSRSGLAVWCALLCVAVALVAKDWHRFSHETSEVFVLHNWFWITVCWIVLKVLHESAHGLVCKLFGGDVRESGVALILFIPLAYVDVTSSWRFRSKWPRIATAGAGIYAELLIAAIAVIVWSGTQSATLASICVNCAVMASATTVLFNANPLMRFDGYFILSELTNLPNLYTTAQQYLNYFWSRYVFGISATPPPLPPRKAVFIRAYAFAMWWWRCLVTAGLILGAAALLHGAGIVLAAAASIAWWGKPMFGWLKLLAAPSAPSAPNRQRFALVAFSVAVVVAALFLWIPWPLKTKAPGIVEFAPLTWVRADSGGFVRELHVRSGQLVEAGQLVATLDSPELVNQCKDLELQLAEARLDNHVQVFGHHMAAYQAGLDEVAAFETRLATKRRQVEHLVLRAPAAGRIIGRDLDSRLGTYLDAGEACLAIGEPDAKEIQFCVRQQDLDDFKSHLGQTISFYIPGHGSLTGTLGSIDPRASQHPPHRSLLTTYGGPLKPAALADAQSANADERLAEPQFVATLDLARSDAAKVSAGARCVVSVRSNATIGQYVFRAATQWIRGKLTPQRG